MTRFLSKNVKEFGNTILKSCEIKLFKSLNILLFIQNYYFIRLKLKVTSELCTFIMEMISLIDFND